jgi:hypothetical protein
MRHECEGSRNQFENVSVTYSIHIKRIKRRELHIYYEFLCIENVMYGTGEMGKYLFI